LIRPAGLGKSSKPIAQKVKGGKTVRQTRRDIQGRSLQEACGNLVIEKALTGAVGVQLRGRGPANNPTGGGKSSIRDKRKVPGKPKKKKGSNNRENKKKKKPFGLSRKKNRRSYSSVRGGISISYRQGFLLKGGLPRGELDYGAAKSSLGRDGRWEKKGGGVTYFGGEASWLKSQ